MKIVFRILAFSFLFCGGISVYAQSILETYYKGNKDSLTKDATQLIQLQEPTFKSESSHNTGSVKDLGLEQPNRFRKHFFKARDGKKIFAYYFPTKSQNTIVLIHGVGTTSYTFNKTAGLLQTATNANVYAIDLRGHGKSDGASGDVDYINQYADDLADIVAAIRKKQPNGKIIIAAHSMGGGITFNYLIAHSSHQIDGVLMFAPLLSQLSPAIKQPQRTKGDTTEPFMKIHIERIIGLKMLNEIQNTSLNHLPVLFFNKPTNDLLRTYSYRANQSMSPENHKIGLKAVNIPFLVLIGTKDEAFDATIMKKTVEANSKGRCEIIEGYSHNGIRHAPEAYQLIGDWFKTLK